MDDLTKHEPIKASERDRLSPVWDMSQERMFIENLLCQRFNYFLIFFSITVAGFGGAKNSIYGEVILVLGSIIIYLFSEVLHWNQKKLNAILDDLYKDDSHPAKIIDDIVGHSRRKIIGVIIPQICAGVLITASVINFIYILLK